MDADDPLWTELQGRYRPERPLGAGGMAEVWLVHDERHGRLVALKLLGEHLASAMGQDRFKREIALLARLQHPNVLSLIDSGENAGRMWYVTPFIEGESLRDLLDREGKLDITEALRLGGELLDALGYAHRSGVVHRDIKPENVLLSQGHALLADFGIAREEGKDRLTATGLSVGTPSYMSPEQVAGEGAGAPSDLYSMGCVLFECLTGQPPFTGPDSRAVMAQHVMDPVPSLRARRPNVPEGVERVVLRALEKDPKDRWPDAAAFARALSEPATSKTNLVPSGIRPARPRARRRRLLAAAGVIVAIAVAAGGVTLWRSRGKLAVGPKVALRQVTFRGDVCASTLSSSGRYLAYFGGKQVWLTDLDVARTWPISDTIVGAGCTTWTPAIYWAFNDTGVVYEDRDSTYLAGTNGDRARVVGSRQLASRVLLSSGTALDIQRDSTGTPILSVGGTGRATRLVPLDGLKDPFVPSWHRHVSPDGSRAFVFFHDSAGQGVVAIVDMDSGRVVVPDSVGARAWFRGTSVFAWSADGRALYAQTSGLGAALGRIELARDRLHLGRRRALLLPELDRTALVTSVATSRNRAALEMGHSTARVLVGLLSSGAAPHRFSVEELSTGSLEPKSADIALRRDRLYFVAAIDTADGLFEMALPSGAPRQVARLEGGGLWLRLSPDGSTALVGSSTADSLFAPALVDLRTGATRILPGWRATTVMSQCHVFDWDPSGRAVLAYSQERVGEQPSIIRMNAVSGVADTLRADSSAVILECPAVSPDGEWVALRYTGGRNGRVGIYLLPLSGGPARALALTSEYPVGWLNARQLVAANLVADSTEIWLHNLDGTGSRLGAFPNARCEGAVLSPSRREIVCVTWRPTQDLWIADDFDPYFRPPAAPKRP